MRIFVKILKFIRRQYKIYKSPWKGNYSSWEEALKKTSSYNSQEIFEKVRIATLNVKNGIYPYERDSVNFDKIEYSYPLLVSLLSAIEDEELIVFDFGGALGSSYFQNKEILQKIGKIKKLRWCVIEQEEFVDIGNKEIRDDNLIFFNSIEEAFDRVGKPKIILLSSVLQYMEEPFVLMNKIKLMNSNYICIDRTIFFEKEKRRICIQSVPKKIYKASYPCWILNKEELINLMDDTYEKINEFDGYIHVDIPFFKDTASTKGIIFKRR